MCATPPVACLYFPGWVGPQEAADGKVKSLRVVSVVPMLCTGLPAG